ncbi:hypothetical protein HY632_01835 [Candidatus Uhrbacteria bacterium]|nr:hypothetical protein [Candidatus Uhrbacteria bacterium]
MTIVGGETALSLLRRAGYAFQKEASGETAFTRRIGGSPFPRYHAYVTESAGSPPAIVINLHIDQKQPTYGAGKVHSGEYDGPLVAQEADRLRTFVQSVAPPPSHRPDADVPKKSWINRFFS